MTKEEIQYEAQSIIQEWGSNDSAPYVEFVEKLASMELPESPSDLDEAAEEYERNLGYYECVNQWPSVAFKAGAEWMAGQAEKDTIERACKWLFSHLPILVDCYNEDIHEKADRSEFIKLFRKSMEEQK